MLVFTFLVVLVTQIYSEVKANSLDRRSKTLVRLSKPIWVKHHRSSGVHLSPQNQKFWTTKQQKIAKNTDLLSKSHFDFVPDRTWNQHFIHCVLFVFEFAKRYFL